MRFILRRPQVLGSGADEMRGIDIDRQALWAISAPEGPVVMVNLFRLKDKARFPEFLRAMQAASAQTIDAAGAEPVYAGAVKGEFIGGEDHWDRIALFRYPSIEALLAALDDDAAFERAQDIRREYLDDARFFLTTPLGVPIEPSANHAGTLAFDVAAREAQVIGERPRIAPLANDQVTVDGERPLLEIGKAVGRDTEQAEMPAAITTVMHHPAIFRHQVALSVELNASGTIPPRERELAVLCTAWLCRAPYAWGQHVENARQLAMTAEEIERVTLGSSADGWSEHETALLRAVEELLGDQSICDETWSVLARSWNDQQLIELPVLVGLYFTFAMQHNSIRVGLPQGNKGLRER